MASAKKSRYAIIKKSNVATIYFYPSIIALLDPTSEQEVKEVITQANESKGMITRLYPLDISSIGAYIE